MFTPHPPPSASASPTRGEAKTLAYLFNNIPTRGEAKTLAYLFNNIPTKGEAKTLAYLFNNIPTRGEARSCFFFSKFFASPLVGEADAEGGG
jgi:hypothetical protein